MIRTIQDSVRFSCTCCFQKFENDLVTIAYSSNSITTFNISNPLNPIEKKYLQSNQLYGPNRLSIIENKAYMINSVNDNFTEIDLSGETPKINYIVPSWMLEKVYGLTTNNGLLYMVGRDSRYFLIIDPKIYIKN
ncbi:MAG: hypothetical protein HC830_01460 [Bacteroidetes bacterium]|nr:hypothetical protein [Bacteroidales bacterium]NJO68104.1 hypothetical protein [Bacteroidota bacterium]